MKARLEWKDGDVWRQVNIEVKYSRNSNLWFQHNGIFFAFPALKEGAEVVSKNSQGRWVPAGRITRGSIFLGDGLSFSETNELKFKQKMEVKI